MLGTWRLDVAGPSGGAARLTGEVAPSLDVKRLGVRVALGVLLSDRLAVQNSVMSGLKPVVTQLEVGLIVSKAAKTSPSHALGKLLGIGFGKKVTDSRAISPRYKAILDSTIGDVLSVERDAKERKRRLAHRAVIRCSIHFPDGDVLHAIVRLVEPVKAAFI